MSIAERLPVLTIHVLPGDSPGQCQFSKAAPTRVPSQVDVWVDDETFVPARVTTLHEDTGLATFTTEHAHALRVGATYRWLDGYWGERVQLTLDRTRKWTQLEYQPSDTVTYWPDGTTTPHPGGWDHDHCVICWGKVGVCGDEHGFVDEDEGEWLCEECHSSHVARRNIDFVNLEQMCRELRHKPSTA